MRTCDNRGMVPLDVIYLSASSQDGSLVCFQGTWKTCPRSERRNPLKWEDICVGRDPDSSLSKAISLKLLAGDNNHCRCFQSSFPCHIQNVFWTSAPSSPYGKRGFVSRSSVAEISRLLLYMWNRPLPCSYFALEYVKHYLQAFLVLRFTVTEKLIVYFGTSLGFHQLPDFECNVLKITVFWEGLVLSPSSGKTKKLSLCFIKHQAMRDIEEWRYSSAHS